MKRAILISVFVLCLLNFFVFVLVAMRIGGDAMNGKAVNGHFYLGSHGRLKEVSEGVFLYSLWHVRTLFFTHPIAILAGWLLMRSGILKSIIGKRVIPPRGP